MLLRCLWQMFSRSTALTQPLLLAQPAISAWRKLPTRELGSAACVSFRHTAPAPHKQQPQTPPVRHQRSTSRARLPVAASVAPEAVQASAAGEAAAAEGAGAAPLADSEEQQEQEQQEQGQGSMQPIAKKQKVEGGMEGGSQQKPQQPQQPQQQKQQQQRKKKKPASPEILARMAIHQAAKENDLAGALSAFDRAKAEGVRLNTDLYVSLLYLCSGGDGWETSVQRMYGGGEQAAAEGEQAAAAGEHAAGGEVARGEDGSAQGADQADQAAGDAEGEARVAPDAAASAAATEAASGAEAAASAVAAAAPPPLRQLSEGEVRQRAQQLFDEMKASEGRLTLNEMCFTALARLEARGGDADRAFALAQEMVAQGMDPKLRSFTPALIAYAEQGNADKAFEVDAAIAEQQLDLTESEFARLVQAAAAGDASPASWHRAASVLRRIGSELTVLQPDTLSRIHALFASPPAAAAAAAAACALSPPSPATAKA